MVGTARARACSAIAILGLVLGSLAAPVRAQGDALRGPDAAFDAIEIAGFVVPISEIGALIARGVLTFDEAQGQFRFDPAIGSERALRRRLAEAPQGSDRAILDLWRVSRVAFPSAAPITLTVPSGFGPAVFSNQREGVSLGLAVGGVSRVPYTSEPDGGISLGLGFGNAFETLGVALGVGLNDLSEPTNTDRVAFSFQLSRYLWDGLSVAAGGENLFVAETDGDESYYLVASRAYRASDWPLPLKGVATLGLGSGRFASLTDRDRAEDVDGAATTVFGGLALELNGQVNALADWNGRNLNAGVSLRLPGTALLLRAGVRDLTDNSGDGPRLTGSVSVPLARFTR